MRHGLNQAWCAALAIGMAPILATLSLATDSETESLRRTPIVEAVERAMPSVVNIHGPKMVTDSASEPQRRVNGMGTGVVIDERGYILTNYHVIDGVRPIEVTLADNRTYTARLVARDAHTDLAIVKIKTNESLPVISIGTSSDLMLGETVVAIGNAFGYHGTITRGMISALNRTVEVTDAQRYVDLIQTDASINPGNSGGPLLNVFGDMIGINVAVRVGADGIAFAIPSDRALEVAANLLATDQTCGTWHGVEGRSLARQRGWTFVVERVLSGSPAEACGLKAGDRIVRVGDVRVERQLDIERALLGLRPGTEARIQVVREERTLPIQLVVATVPDVPRGHAAERLVW
ncbi:MAG TPA: trypsin-like peptidase domain-containing protein, partial [Pirellulaceae bacterium]